MKRDGKCRQVKGGERGLESCPKKRVHGRCTARMKKHPHSPIHSCTCRANLLTNTNT